MFKKKDIFKKIDQKSSGLAAWGNNRLKYVSLVWGTKNYSLSHPLSLSLTLSLYLSLILPPLPLPPTFNRSRRLGLIATTSTSTLFSESLVVFVIVKV